MARYIDADKLIERIEASPSFQNFGMDGYFLRDLVINLINRQPMVELIVSTKKIYTGGEKQ